MSEYVITVVRFPFWNGKNRYTLEYCPPLRSWYVFRNDDSRDAIYQKKLSRPVRKKDINCDSAELIINEFIESLPA